MRLWFAGWEPHDFKSEPSKYLETEQKTTFAPYASFAETMATLLRPKGALILHLGETNRVNMSHHILPHLEPFFETVHVGRESVAMTESHGIRDKGSTVAHWYLFATKR